MHTDKNEWIKKQRKKIKIKEKTLNIQKLAGITGK